MNLLNAAQRMQKIERFEKLTMSEYEALVSVNEQLRQRVAELEQQLTGVRRAEREKCAKVCDENHWDDHRLFAEKIRAME